MNHVFASCRIGDAELEQDPAANLLTSASEEAQKVARNEGKVAFIKACIVHGYLLAFTSFLLMSCWLKSTEQATAKNASMAV